MKRPSDKERLDWLAEQPKGMLTTLATMTAWERTHGGWNKTDAANFRHCIDASMTAPTRFDRPAQGEKD